MHRQIVSSVLVVTERQLLSIIFQANTVLLQRKKDVAIAHKTAARENTLSKDLSYYNFVFAFFSTCP